MSQLSALSWHHPPSWTWPLTPSSQDNCCRRFCLLLLLLLLHFHFRTLLRLWRSPLHRLPLRSLLPGKLPRRSCSCWCSHLQKLGGWCIPVIFDFPGNCILSAVWIHKQEYLWLTGSCKVLLLTYFYFTWVFLSHASLNYIPYLVIYQDFSYKMRMVALIIQVRLFAHSFLGISWTDQEICV